MSERKTAFWDFDGTLAFSESLWSKAHARALESCGVKGITPDYIRPFTRRAYPWDNIGRDSFKGDEWWTNLERNFVEVYADIGVDRQTGAKAAALIRGLVLRRENFRLDDNAIRTLTVAKGRGYENYILSNNFPELPELCDDLGLSPYISGVIVSAEFGYDKPQREIFDVAKQIAGNPTHCVMTGDNPYADVTGARNAGMISVLIEYRAQKNEGSPDYSCKDLGQAAELFISKIL